MISSEGEQGLVVIIYPDMGIGQVTYENELYIVTGNYHPAKAPI